MTLGSVLAVVVACVTFSLSQSSDLQLKAVAGPIGQWHNLGSLSDNFNGVSYYGRDVNKTAPNPLIVNGKLTAITEFPHTLRLYLTRVNPETNELFLWGGCGGSLLTPTLAITAGHCVNVPGAIGVPNFAIGMGVTDLAKLRTLSDANAQFIKVSKVILHEKYEDVFDYDIALLELSAPVVLTEFAKTISLSRGGRSESVWRLARRNKCYAAGWGRDLDKTITNDALLKSEQFLVMKNSVCEIEWKRIGGPDWTLSPRTVCIVDRQQNTSPCQGDSGGPLTCVDRRGRARLVGLTSWGFTACTPGWPTAYTRISSYLPWIIAHARASQNRS